MSERYLLLRSYRGALDALEEKTFGDINNFTDQTAEEILQEIKDEIHGQAVEMFEMEKEQLVTKLDGYERNIHELEKKNDISEQEIRSTHSNLDKISNNVATVLSSLIYVLLIFVIAIGTWAQFKSSFLEQSIYLRVGSILLTLILGALSVYSGFNIKNTRFKTKEYIRNNVYNFLTGKR
ncbi:hypothetical protein AN963_20765 [Brevibacillus choshinensis]|uniref:Uncharacterized protein n=1 Tax=Brevibacillus choshinensis TaxID=54911 RepID=A0ABR5N0B6_BRECH|nr:hypothetical protein [Brevibacillus choshinensis]KQL43896.1 hypothetical protein AN963_20765 [Brevibacillus choshinensis]